MASKKRNTIGDNPFRKTEPEQPKQPTKKMTPRGVVLEPEELKDLQQIAGALSISVHQLLQYAVRDFLRRYHAGEIKPETEQVTTTRLKMPDD